MLPVIAVCTSIAVSYGSEEQLTWEELSKQYEFPAWYTEARFGIWVHWGAQTQPEEGGGWYAAHMYKQAGELYNLIEDIGEKKNLASANPEKVRALAKILGDHLRETGALMSIDKTTKKAVPYPDDVILSIPAI